MDIISYILIPVAIAAMAYFGAKFAKQGLGGDGWHESLRKPSWTPPGALIREIWIFIYVVTGLAILWYWNVPVISWVHFVTAVALLVNFYLNATWNRTFFVEHDLSKAYRHILKLDATTALVIILMFLASPIASMLMLPYLVWLVIATYLTKQIMEMNKRESLN